MGLRGSLWRLFAVLASIVLPVAMASAWLATVVIDTDSYVDTVAPLASDDTIREAATDVLQTAAVGSIEDTTGRTLNATRREQVTAVVGVSVDSPEFEEVWRTANRTAHEQVVAILEDEDDTHVNDNGQVVVELGPIMDSVAQALDERGVVDASRVPSVNASLPVASVSDLERARTAYQLLDAAGLWVPALWVVLVALTLLVAAERRRALVWLAVGSVIGLVVLVLGLLAARGVLVGELGSSTEDDVVRAVWDVLVSKLYWATGIGFVVAVAAIVLAALLPRRSPPVGSLVR